MKPQIKSKKASIITLLIAMVMIISCFTTACQPTNTSAIEGEEEYTNPAIEDTIATENEAIEPVSYQKNTYVAPKNIEYTLEGDGGETGAPIEVKVDAEVTIPENALPVIKVQPKEITYEQLKTVLDLLVGDTPLYDEFFATQYRLKSDIQHQIDIYNWEIEMAEKEPNGEEYVTKYSGLIENLKKNLETAPETYAEAIAQSETSANVTDVTPAGTLAPGVTPMPVPALPTSSYDGAVEINEATYNNGRNDLLIGEGKTADTLYYDASIDAEYKQSIVYRHKVYDGARTLSISNIYVPNIMDGFSLSKDDAISVAQPIANAIDPSLELTNVMDAVHTDYSKDDNPSYPFGYTLVYERNYNGVNTRNTGFFPLYRVYQESVYEKPLQQEYLSITVGVDGVQKLEYYAPIEKVETLSDSADLLPFEQIEGIFKENIVIHDSYSENKKLLKVTNIELGLMKLYFPETNEYVITPVWNFFGGSISGNPAKVDWSHINQFHGRSFLTVNAIDGSIIDHVERRKGENAPFGATPSPMITPIPTPNISESTTATGEFEYIDEVPIATNFSAGKLYTSKWDDESHKEAFQNQQKIYTNGLGMFIPSELIADSWGRDSATWNLNGEYEKIQFDLGCDPSWSYGNYSKHGSYNITISADGQRIYKSDTMYFDSFIDDKIITLPPNTLEIEISLSQKKGTKGTLRVVMGDFKLYKEQ